MATLTHRTAFALDKPAVTQIRALAARWSMWRAAVIRRGVAQA